MTRHLISLILLTLVLVSCGVDGKHFKLEGRFLHLNQGEFYVYSTDGLLVGIDTVKIQGGRFAYEIPCDEDGTLVMVFPNFSEQPVFAAPGKTVEINADASHLKELEAEGTKDNKLMTGFRKQVASMSPAQTAEAAESFIRHNPESQVGIWLVRKYFLATPTPDYKKARALLETMQKEQPKNGQIARLQQQVKYLGNTNVGGKIPAFTAKDIHGNRITQTEIQKAPMAVVYLWASWNYESTDIQRILKYAKKEKGDRLAVIGISIDPSLAETRKQLERDSITWPIVNDGMMFDCKLARQLSLTSIPDNIVLQNGRIVARNLTRKQLKEKLEEKEKNKK